MCNKIRHTVREYLRMQGMDRKYQEDGYAVNVFNQSAFVSDVHRFLMRNSKVWRQLFDAGLVAKHHWIMAVRTKHAEHEPESERFPFFGPEGMDLGDVSR